MPRCQPASLQRLPSPVIPTSAPRCCPNQSPEVRSEGRPVGSSIPTTSKVSESLMPAQKTATSHWGEGQQAVRVPVPCEPAANLLTNRS